MDRMKFHLIILTLISTFFVVQIISSTIIHWKKYDFIGGLICESSKILFSVTVHDPYECSKICFTQHSCLVSSFKPDSHECIGCQELKIWNIEMDHAINYAIRPYKSVGYMLVTEDKTWGDASLHCQTLGGHLADITSEEEEIYIEDQVFDSSYQYYTWIGASRDTSGGIFYWEDGTPILDYFVKWGPSQPNYNQGENCVLMLSWDNAWSWHDYGCHEVFWSLCEFD